MQGMPLDAEVLPQPSASWAHSLEKRTDKCLGSDCCEGEALSRDGGTPEKASLSLHRDGHGGLPGGSDVL